MEGAHVCDPPMALEGLLLCNEAIPAHREGSSAHTASVVPVHSREWEEEEEEGEPQGGGHGIQTASHQQNKNTDQCKDQEEGNAFHEHTACNLMTEGGNLGVDAYDLLEGAFHDQGVVHTCADGAE